MQTPPQTQMTVPPDVRAAWRAAAAEAGLALRSWYAATTTRRAEAYAVYRAAADREAAALDDLDRSSARRAPI